MPPPWRRRPNTREADKDVIGIFFKIYGQNRQARETEAHRFARTLDVKLDAG